MLLETCISITGRDDKKVLCKTDNEKNNNDKYNKLKSVFTFQDRGVSGKNMFLCKISAGE